MEQRVTTDGNGRQRMTTSGTTSDNKWQRVIQGVITNYNKLQRMTTSGTTNENKWKRMRARKRELFWFQNKIKYALYNYIILSNIDYLWIGKLKTYIFNIIFYVSIMEVFLHVFRYLFCWSLFKHIKLNVKYECLFENIM